MLKIILKKSIFYYLIAFVVVFQAMDLNTLHVIRLKNLMQYLNSSNPQSRILLYDYLTRLNPQNDVFFFRLGQSYVSWGDYPNAINAFQQAIFIKPQDKSYQKALNSVHQLARK